MRRCSLATSTETDGISARNIEINIKGDHQLVNASACAIGPRCRIASTEGAKGKWYGEIQLLVLAFVQIEYLFMKKFMMNF